MTLKSLWGLFSQVLAARKEPEQGPVPLAIFEAPDPTKKPMYCKHLVYQGTTEFSFEELRAIKWRKRQAEAQVEAKRAELERLAVELEEKKEAALRNQEEDFRRRQEEFMIKQEAMMREQQER